MDEARFQKGQVSVQKAPTCVAYGKCVLTQSVSMILISRLERDSVHSHPLPVPPAHHRRAISICKHLQLPFQLHYHRRKHMRWIGGKQHQANTPALIATHRCLQFEQLPNESIRLFSHNFKTNIGAFKCIWNGSCFRHRFFLREIAERSEPRSSSHHLSKYSVSVG